MPMKDLTVLTPPLLVCAAFLVAVGVFLRHEMGVKRRRGDHDGSAEISADGGIPDHVDDDPSAPQEGTRTPEQFDGGRSSG
jgi:hypothetical protein